MGAPTWGGAAARPGIDASQARAGALHKASPSDRSSDIVALAGVPGILVAMGFRSAGLRDGHGA